MSNPTPVIEVRDLHKSFGNLEVLKWARANGCPWDEGTCAEVARNGHLEVLKWARAQRCPRGAGTCALTARGRHLEVLQ